MATDRFLVTGSMGCLGAWVIRHLLDDGSSVVGLDLSTDARRLRMLASDDELANVTFVEADISDPEMVERTVSDHGITHIIHTAALQIPFVRARPSLGASVNVTGTVNVFEAAVSLRERVRSVVYASAAGVFGPPSMYPEGVLRDDSLQAPQTLYGVFKQANEGTARIYHAEQGMPSIGLRPWIIYGLGRDQGLTSVITTAMVAAAAAVPYHITFGGESLFQFAPDVARAFVSAARARPQLAETYNLGGVTTSVAEIVEQLGEIRPASRGLITIDTATLPVAARVDASRFEREIDASPPTSLREGVERTVAAFGRLLEDGTVKPPT
jgi:nucleoside-diphosphate-sugar epimerase